MQGATNTLKPLVRLKDGASFEVQTKKPDAPVRPWNGWLDGPQFKCDHCHEWKPETSMNIVVPRRAVTGRQSLRQLQVCVHCAVANMNGLYTVIDPSPGIYFVAKRLGISIANV